MHLVRQADITVALVGEHPSRSGEANSVANIGLPAGQLEVVRAIASIGKPLVVVVFIGRSLDLGEVLDLADAVLVAWRPGVEAGPALIETLFSDRAPGGRLPMTFPRSVGHLPSSSHTRPTARAIDAADDPVTGRYLDALVSPRLPFGSGLTYTAFSYGPIRLSNSRDATAGRIHRGGRRRHQFGSTPGPRSRAALPSRCRCRRDPAAARAADWVSLVLDAGATGTATFTVTPAQLSYYDRTMTCGSTPGKPWSRSVRTLPAAPRPG